MLTEDNQASTHCSSGGSATGRLERQEHSWHQEDTTDSRQHSHSDIWHAWSEVILSDILEIEVAIKSSQPSGECKKKLCKWGVNVHKELSLDVFGCETTEAEQTTLAKGKYSRKW
jgi:hypothetical protein